MAQSLSNMGAAAVRSFSHPLPAIAAVPVMALAGYKTTEKLTAHGDWQNPTAYADGAARAGQPMGLAGGVALAGLGVMLVTANKSHLTAASRRLRLGTSALMVGGGAAYLGGAQQAMLKSHERMEKPFIEVRHSGKIEHSINAVPNEAKDILKGAGNIAGGVAGAAMDAGANVIGGIAGAVSGIMGR